MRYLAFVASVVLGTTVVCMGDVAESEKQLPHAAKPQVAEAREEYGVDRVLTTSDSGQESDVADSGAEGPLLWPEPLGPSRIGPDTFRLAVSGTAFDVGTPPYTRFIARRGAGARITTYPTTLAPRAPLVRHDYGPWSLSTGLSVSGHYTDNVFLTPSGEKSEWTTVITPRIGLEWSVPNFAAAVRYGAQFHRPDKFRENRREDHQVGLQAQWTVRNSLTARLENVYGWRTVAANFEGDEFTRYWDNQTVLGLTYNPWPDWEADLSYDRYQARFDEVTSDDVTINGFGCTLSRRVFPAVWGQARLHYALVANRDVGGLNTDNDECTASLGFRFDPLAPVTGTVHVGYTQRDYESSQIGDKNGLFVNAGLTYSPRRWAHVFLTTARSIEETSVTALNQAAGSYNYERTSTSLGARFDVTDRWGFGLLGFYARDDYSEANRQDDLYGGSVSLFYELSDRARLALRYQYQENDSDQNANDFTENFVNLGLEISF